MTSQFSPVDAPGAAGDDRNSRTPSDEGSNYLYPGDAAKIENDLDGELAIFSTLFDR